MPSKGIYRLLNQYDCGCQVRRGSLGSYFIYACALHNTAPELLKACEQLLAAPSLNEDNLHAADRRAIRSAHAAIDNATCPTSTPQPY